RPDRALQSGFSHGPIAVYVLPYQVNLFDAPPAQIEDLADDLRSRKARFPAPRKGNDAVGAKFIAALDYRHKCDIWRMLLAFGYRPIVVGFPFAEVGKTGTVLENRLDRIGRTANRSSSQNQVNTLNFLEKRLALELRHAAHYADHRFTAR